MLILRHSRCFGGSCSRVFCGLSGFALLKMNCGFKGFSLPKLFLKMIEYHIPKLARSEVTGANGGPITLADFLNSLPAP